MNVFKWYFKSNLLLRIAIGLIAGAIAGLIFGTGISWVSPFGDIFVRLLKMIVMPVVLFTLVVGAASVHPARLGRVGLKALLIYIVTTAFAVALGLVFGNLFRPGAGLQLAGIDAGVAMKAMTPPSLIDTVINIIPKNPFTAIASGEILPTIFSALIFGIGIAYLRESNNKRISEAANTVFKFFEGSAEAMYLIVNWILQYAPIGVFALIAVVFGKQGAEAFGPLGMLTLAIYCAFIGHLLIVYGGLLALYGINLITFINKAKDAIITAFVTRSSGGTLPVTMEIAKTEMGISQGVYSFSLPLGATLNMDGTAIYQGVCALFIGFAIDMPLSFNQQVTVILTAVLASLGTAGVPGAGAIMLMMVLNSVGLNIEPGTTIAAAYAMIFGIDALLDMGRTALNVTGDLAVTCVVAKSEKEFDESLWQKESTGEEVKENA